MAPLLRVFRSVWGMKKVVGIQSLVRELQQQGFAGVEASLGDVDRIAGGKANRAQWREALGEAGLQHVVGVYSSWQDYEGHWEDLPLDEHVRVLADQMHQAKELNPIHVNCHSGQDTWDTAESEAFFEKALRAQDDVGFACGVSHETHRGRILGNPWRTEKLLKKFPALQLTGDFSHWFLVSERFLYGTERDKQLWRCVIPRTQHLHTRIGGEQKPQMDNPKAVSSQEAVEVHSAIWSEVFRAQAKAGKEFCSATPEYGPPPYGKSEDTGAIACTEASRIRGLFHKAFSLRFAADDE
eukprot:CAMPEP_0206216902 /NCGR_PEP_ID=MMETSP0047_2-20121206/2981_1 /ASSEMBLY_ACC=CAM_ASM_000192 /TAXON_ID=195065 /ORGANISM="Chroomonas mesostigmatica_cf, Strain CCMP1168" /LENGTH=296 /DNA_ID=CAMNT_0053639305 /DNA_START=18 /DNA_END=906 /DNA_ORIENTATION=+